MPDPIMQERADQLKGRLTAENPEAWNFDEQPEVVGIYTRLERAHTAYGPKWVIELKLLDDTVRSVWLFHTALRNELAKLKPVEGELLAIAYLGKKRTEDGRTEYDAYRVVVDRGPTAHAWDAVAETVTGDQVAAPEPAPAGHQPPPPQPPRPAPALPPDQGGPSVHHGPGPCPACECLAGDTHADGCPDDLPY